MLLLLLGIALGADDTHEIKANTAERVAGPAVWMTDGRYRAFVADSRKLVSCEVDLDKAIDEGIAANARAVRARDVAEGEFNDDEELVDRLVQDNALLGAQLDQERLANSRVRTQRNTAWAISGGFLAASAAATAIALSK